MADDGMSWLLQVKFWILLILSSLSIVCSVFIFIYFYRQRKKLAIHHHLNLVLIILSFMQMITDFPFALIYYHHGKVIPTSNSFCLWWNWWDYSLEGALLFTMAWGSIERHLLIFHNFLVSTRRKRIIFHILPTLSVCVYPWIFYFAAIILNSCENDWYYDVDLCLESCYLTAQPTLALYDTLADVVLPIGVITVANVILIGRVLWQKRNQQEAWRRQRKLTIQLLSIAALYIVMWLPLTINGIMYTCSGSDILGNLQGEYFLFLPAVLTTLIPFVFLPFLSDFKKTVFKWREITVAPSTINMPRPPNV